MADKSYEAYQMLAKLLNSEQKENIDRAYNALSDALDKAYTKTVRENSDEFSKKRDALARNKAQSDKYLSYFMTDKGYANSGTEADARLKSQLGYDSDLAALHAAEASAQAKAEEEHNEAALKNEIERNSKKAAADKELGDSLYKMYKDERDGEIQREKIKSDKIKSDNDVKNRQLEINKELKEKDYEIKLLQAQASAARSGGTDKAENAALKEKLSSYRQLLYNETLDKFKRAASLDEMQSIYDSVTGVETLDKFKRAASLDEMQSIYDSVTGVNAETAADVFGEKLYNDMIKSFSKSLSDAKTKRADEAAVQKLYDRFVNAKDEYHQRTYMKLKRELAYSNFPGFTADQLERAYKLYLNNGMAE